MAAGALSVWILALFISMQLSSAIGWMVLRDYKKNLRLLERQKECLNAEIERLRTTLKQRAFKEEQQRQLLEESLIKLREAAHVAAERTHSLEISLQATLAEKEQMGVELTQHAHALQISLEEALDKLKAVETKAYFEQETIATAKLLKGEHLQLRKQFEEKDQTLREARQAFFEMESRFLVLDRELAEQLLQRSAREEISEAEALEAHRESIHFEWQTEQLEQMVTHLLEKEVEIASSSEKPKAKRGRPARKKSNPLEEILELQFDKSF